ncbi:hypothetical protein AVEN_144827-1 [Araneus ventricosus]|uniref:Uncharacterized protein n=1 Tax=Araneus ventricosus TaxID=182803 RepID=A0A4Y2T496_ARAVE|nr:hypothetical protein AVEN_144827-1 [Araneus ventricosus]
MRECVSNRFPRKSHHLCPDLSFLIRPSNNLLLNVKFLQTRAPAASDFDYKRLPLTLLLELYQKDLQDSIFHWTAKSDMTDRLKTIRVDLSVRTASLYTMQFLIASPRLEGSRITTYRKRQDNGVEMVDAEIITVEDGPPKRPVPVIAASISAVKENALRILKEREATLSEGGASKMGVESEEDGSFSGEKEEIPSVPALKQEADSNSEEETGFLGSDQIDNAYTIEGNQLRPQNSIHACYNSAGGAQLCTTSNEDFKSGHHVTFETLNKTLNINYIKAPHKKASPAQKFRIKLRNDLYNRQEFAESNPRFTEDEFKKKFDGRLSAKRPVGLREVVAHEYL